MAWLIQRTAPSEPTAYYVENGSQRGRWILKPPCTKIAGVTKPRIPALACRFFDYDVAFDIASWLRDNLPLEYGEVIAIVTEPEAA